MLKSYRYKLTFLKSRDCVLETTIRKFRYPALLKPFQRFRIRQCFRYSILSCKGQERARCYIWLRLEQVLHDCHQAKLNIELPLGFQDNFSLEKSKCQNVLRAAVIEHTPCDRGVVGLNPVGCWGFSSLHICGASLIRSLMEEQPYVLEPK